MAGAGSRYPSLRQAGGAPTQAVGRQAGGGGVERGGGAQAVAGTHGAVAEMQKRRQGT